MVCFKETQGENWSLGGGRVIRHESRAPGEREGGEGRGREGVTQHQQVRDARGGAAGTSHHPWIQTGGRYGRGGVSSRQYGRDAQCLVVIGRGTRRPRLVAQAVTGAMRRERDYAGRIEGPEPPEEGSDRLTIGAVAWLADRRVPASATSCRASLGTATTRSRTASSKG